MWCQQSRIHRHSLQRPLMEVIESGKSKDLFFSQPKMHLQKESAACCHGSRKIFAIRMGGSTGVQFAGRCSKTLSGQPVSTIRYIAVVSANTHIFTRAGKRELNTIRNHFVMACRRGRRGGRSGGGASVSLDESRLFFSHPPIQCRWPPQRGSGCVFPAIVVCCYSYSRAGKLAESYP